MKNRTEAESKPWKLLLWTAVAGLVFGLIGFGEIAEDYLRTVRNSFHRHAASGQIVLLKIDDRSLRDVGRWPWPRREFAQITDELARAGARRVFFDFVFNGSSDAADDARLAQSLQRYGKAYIAVRSRSGNDAAGSNVFGDQAPIFGRYARLADISSRYNYQNAVWQLPFVLGSTSNPIASFSAQLANRQGETGELYRLDYSIDPASIPSVSASAVWNGRIDPKLVRNKDVVVAGDSEILGDQFFIPGTGRKPGAYIQVIGAETLKQGRPIDLGWVPAFIAALAITAFAVSRLRPGGQALMIAAGIVAVMGLPVPLEARLVFLDITPGLFVMLVVGGVTAWRQLRTKGFVNPISNLPNLSALRANRQGRDRALIAARVLNYEEIVATLSGDKERQLVDQIASRLRVGAPHRLLYHGDRGIFAWFDDPHQPVGNHLDALYAMFRNPARVDGRPLDLSIAFGVEAGSGRSLTNRLASALVAAEEAAHHGLKWKYHEPETLENASWKLSILSQLDEAIDRGEVWVAFQPKFDVRTREIVGAEALARWTHPQKGPIAASEFVAAAEQHDRIAKLTDFVLEKAVSAAAEITKRDPGFTMAANLSARLLTDKGLPLRLAALLARHRLAAKNLTLELTETAALTDTGGGLDMIARLRELGIAIAIDDYGTGQSTLEYLKKIPASEIKIDQSFVKGIVDNRSDRLMVQSTISLAHSLGRKVVAEGVEHRDIFDVLAELQCDIAQGFALGRPMSLEALTKRVFTTRRRTAA